VSNLLKKQRLGLGWRCFAAARRCTLQEQGGATRIRQHGARLHTSNGDAVVNGPRKSPRIAALPFAPLRAFNANSGRECGRSDLTSATLISQQAS
jgi:hypothetical protein